MRKYAILKKPLKLTDKDYIYKIMLHKDHEDVYLYEYCSMDAIQCTYDVWYSDVETVYDEWDDVIDEHGWIDIGDPLPGCQHDAFLPIRIKGRSIGKPQWGCFEILVNGQWENYAPNYMLNRKPDVKANITLTRRNPVFTGYRPAHLIGDYLTTGIHEYLNVKELHQGETVEGFITFITPEFYPHSLKIGARIVFREGERITGYADILEIYNELLIEEQP